MMTSRLTSRAQTNHTTDSTPAVATTRRALAACLLATALAAALPAGTRASSHREAPAISKDAFADNTDTYVFVSPTNPDNVVLIASWIPFEHPSGGPNYFEFDDAVTYGIHVDNDGDARADVTYTLRSTTTTRSPDTFLYNVAPITAPGDASHNRFQTYTVTEATAGGTAALVTDAPAPPVNIGAKSTPGYQALADQAIRQVTAGGDTIKIFAGQVDDAFWVDLQVFDLLTLRGQPAPVGYAGGHNTPSDSVEGFNNHSLVIEVPIARLVQGGEPVLGVWATAHRGGSQVSRLGMPLVNEVVLPLGLKDTFNMIAPEIDLTVFHLLQESVENPEVGRLLCALYGVPLPGDADDDCNTELTLGTPRSGRGDIFDIFLTGMVLASPFTIQTATGPVELPAGFNVNRPQNVVPAEMIRINTAIKGDLCAPVPSRLGVLGGDACGFPNGRRLSDDVVEIELLAVAGAAYEALDDRDATFSFDPALIGVLTDGVDFNDKPFRTVFPYMATAHSGQDFESSATGGVRSGTGTPLQCYDVRNTPGTPRFPKGTAAVEDALAGLKDKQIRRVESFCAPAAVDGLGAAASQADLVCFVSRDERGQAELPRKTDLAADTILGPVSIRATEGTRTCVPVSSLIIRPQL